MSSVVETSQKKYTEGNQRMSPLRIAPVDMTWRDAIKSSTRVGVLIEKTFLTNMHNKKDYFTATFSA